MKITFKKLSAQEMYDQGIEKSLYISPVFISTVSFFSVAVLLINALINLNMRYQTAMDNLARVQSEYEQVLHAAIDYQK